MEFQAVNFRPLVGSQAELAPYLAGLNVTEALRDFEHLADRVLAPEDSRTQEAWQPASFGDAPTAATSIYGSSFLPYMLDASSPDSPGGYSSATSSSMSSTAGSHWSQASSPLGSDHSPFSYSSNSCSSFSPSVASSVCSDPDEPRAEKSSSRRRSSRRARCEKGGIDRKRQNASAAGRYRQKLKGRLSNLDEELERERARNSELLQSFESKLELYREFADLLAANTRDPSHDRDLARIGSRSLENIIERICPAQFLTSQRVELERLREHFRRVLSIAATFQPQP